MIRSDACILELDHDLPVVPGYRIKELLGGGATARVYRAEMESLGMEVALKVAKPSPRNNAWLLREARLTARLDHPGVVHAMDAGVVDGQAYFVMECIEGNDLQTLLDLGETFDEHQVVDVLLQMADALVHVEDRHLVHGDLKPANLIRARGGRIKMVDFGIARSRDASPGDGGPRKGTVTGTPLYLSPEQATGEDLDIRSDIYSLGITAFALLTGQPPFEGPAPQVLRQQISEPLPGLPATVSAPVRQLVARMCRKDRADRFESAVALRAALQRVERSLRSAAQRGPGRRMRSRRWI